MVLVILVMVISVSVFVILVIVFEVLVLVSVLALVVHGRHSMPHDSPALHTGLTCIAESQQLILSQSTSNDRTTDSQKGKGASDGGGAFPETEFDL